MHIIVCYEVVRNNELDVIKATWIDLVNMLSEKYIVQYYLRKLKAHV